MYVKYCGSQNERKGETSPTLTRERDDYIEYLPRDPLDGRNLVEAERRRLRKPCSEHQGPKSQNTSACSNFWALRAISVTIRKGEPSPTLTRGKDDYIEHLTRGLLYVRHVSK